MASELIVLEPVFHNNIWGGRKLEREFGYAIPDGPVGECWAISAHPHGDCRIVEGPGKGGRLSELWETQPELFGAHEPGAPFPLLVKIIDAERDLSIQVHPDDAYANAHEKGSLGKRECWYVLEAAPGASVVIGQNAKNRQEFQELLDKGCWDELLNKMPVHAGDFFQIDPGTVHALMAGTMILETQQSSDVTYRLYDYDRPDADGNLRELHIEKSLDVINYDAKPIESRLDADSLLKKEAGAASGVVVLEKNDSYTVGLVQVQGELTLPKTQAWWCLSVVEGEGSVAGRRVHKGIHLIVPKTLDTVRFEGALRLVISHP